MEAMQKFIKPVSNYGRCDQLVNLAGCTLLNGPLKFKTVFVVKMFRDLPPSVLNIYSK